MRNPRSEREESNDRSLEQAPARSVGRSDATRVSTQLWERFFRFSLFFFSRAFKRQVSVFECAL